MNPFNPAWVFAEGRSGVWYSEDGGATWHGLHNPGDPMALAGGEWGGVAFDPAVENHVIVGGGEGFLQRVPGESTWRQRSPAPLFGPEISVIALDLNGQPPQPAPGVTPTIAPTSPPIAAAPTSTSPPAQPTAPPEVVSTPTPAPTGGRGICGGIAALPLTLMGLVWINRRRR